MEASGAGRHDLILRLLTVPVERLHPSLQEVTMLSDTEHHGIEGLLPGPALAFRYEGRTW